MYPSRTELSQLHESVRLSAVLAPHYVRSCASCEHVEPCECSLVFSCPLCSFEGEKLEIAENHYFQAHWKAKIFIGSKYVLFPCGTVHATARQSLVNHRSVGFNFHCPLCPTAGGTEQLIQQHVLVSHPSIFAGVPEVDGVASISVFTEREFAIDISNTMNSRIHFDSKVRIREYPLAFSIVEQAGGRTETKKSPVSFENYVSTYEVASMTLIDIEVIGCNRQALRLFKDCCFLVLGIDIAPHTIAAIHSLGGSITGANYLESGEWIRITHILLGDRIGHKPVKQLRRTIAASLISPDSLFWVGSDWVRDRVEKGSLIGTQKVFAPPLVERFFVVRETSLRTERRRTMRAKPEIGTILVESVSSRRPSPVLEPVTETSFQFRSTPEASPVPFSVGAVHNENSIPLMITPHESPVPQPLIPAVLPPMSNRLRRQSLSKVPPSEATPLRRSKRSAVIVSPGKFHLVPHHSIKKD